MGITKKQKEREIVPLPPNSRTKSYSHVSYKYRSLHLFLYRAPSFLFSLIISFSICFSALLCFLCYGWFTLIYFFKFSFRKEIEEIGTNEGVVEACVGREVAIDEVNGDSCTGNNIGLNDEEVEEKEIMEIEKMAEAHIEEEPFLDDEKTEDLLKPEVHIEEEPFLDDEKTEDLLKPEVHIEEEPFLDDEKTEDLLKPEVHIEEEPFLDEEKTEDLLKPEVQGCREASSTRPPPWWSLCGMLEVLIQQKDTK